MNFLRWVVISCFFLTTPVWPALVTDQGSVYFSPDDNLEKRLVHLIEEENKSIYVAIYCLTHREIGEALIKAKKRGVDVQVIVDKYSLKMKSPLAKMVDSGISVSVWDSKGPGNKNNTRALMHNKFCVLGDEIVWTGSFNFTYQADRVHQENVIVLKNSEMATEFKKQFNHIKMRGCLPFSSYITYNPHKLSKKHTQKR